jgi:type IV pilus assembly protein PilA
MVKRFKWFMGQFKYGEKGFTLIELLVVVAILGVLAAVAIPNVTKFIGTGDLAAAQTEAATVNTALGAYFADNHPVIAMADGVVNTNIAPYLAGTALQGKYSCDANGTITGSTFGTTAFKWVGGTWSK